MSLKSKPAPRRVSTKSASRLTFREGNEVDPHVLLPLLHQAPWAKQRTLEDVRLMLRSTDLVLTAWDGACLVGFGRVLTDFVFRATIWDVIVDKRHQRRRIGTELVQRILRHPKLARVELFWLCTRRPGFYERLGFDSKRQTGMVWAREDAGQLE
ncbi:GNAT family N-acetyltransferase [Nitrospira sp.]|nr:GNAT family N-acetyltransferase [Nitrospira sp.]